jgi:hypothetical protein
MRSLLSLGVITLLISAGLIAEQAKPANQPAKPAAPQPAPAPAAAGMTNADVVRMVKAGLGEDLVISAIRGTKNRKFTLTADGLIQLKSDGVSDRVIAVMLNPDAVPPPAAAPPASPAPAPAAPATSAAAPASQTEVSLIASDGTKPIASENGETSQSYAVIKMVVWANFRGLTSDVKTRDKRPTIQIKVNESKFDSRFYLVKAELDKDDNQRSVRMKSGVYTFSTAFNPDDGWVIPTKPVQEPPGVWKMTVTKELPPGEYGVLDVQNRHLYGFTVDK